MWVALAGRASVAEIVRPVKALASSLASSNAPALAGEAQTVVLEKASDWLSGSPDTQSGREVLVR